MRPLFAELWIRSLLKSDLNALIADVKRGDTEAISQAVIFVSCESFGLGHNRARAKLCRYFKNHPPSSSECDRMVEVIVNRLLTGEFSQQFKDQLSMAIRFSPERLQRAASLALNSERDYIRRYGSWVKHVLASSSAIQSK